MWPLDWHNNVTLKTCHQEEKYKQLYIHDDQNVPEDSILDSTHFTGIWNVS